MPHDVTDATFAAEVLDADLPVLVDFWAEWCQPCHRLPPILEQLAQQYAGRLQIVKVDTDANPDVARSYGILSLPTLMVFRRGEVVWRTVGALPASRLSAQLDQILDPAPAA
ncbi:MAG: thioredoxin [Hamadaea sp.]|nr:thioredoxin [Hamadaea sp.]